MVEKAKLQDLANDVGETMREAERAASDGNLVGVTDAHARLHDLLGQVYNAVNDLLDDAGEDPLDWDAIAGNTAHSKGARPLDGTPKGPPPKNP